MRLILPLILLAGAAFPDDLAVGYRLQGLSYEGPGQWAHPADPIWVYDYHLLRITYRAWRLPATTAPILTLRPGAVGPVTPGAMNPENPFAAGKPLTVLTAGDMIADGTPHTLDIELRGKTLTAQMDQVLFSLPSVPRRRWRLSLRIRRPGVACRHPQAHHPWPFHLRGFAGDVPAWTRGDPD
ncbi:MAG: hypothetical protein NTY38_16170 [Acidobacteria bacterium]|nr:hypothetical protein [Acidobacteriota bacterium]